MDVIIINNINFIKISGFYIKFQKNKKSKNTNFQKISLPKSLKKEKKRKKKKTLYDITSHDNAFFAKVSFFAKHNNRYEKCVVIGLY